MHLTKPVLLSAVLSAFALNASAALTSFTSADGVNLVYSTTQNLTFLKDANLLGTMQTAQGASNVISAIIAASPYVFDKPNTQDNPSKSGRHTVTVSDFGSGNGQTTWFGAMAFINYLNSISYAGSTTWRLPVAGPAPGSHGIYQDPDSELSVLLYNEFGAVQNKPSSSTFFDNETSKGFWTSTEAAFSGNNYMFGWNVNTSTSSLLFAGKGASVLYPWAVNTSLTPPAPGSVPVPGAVWLLGIGALGLLRRAKSS